MGWLIALVVLTGLALMPLGVKAIYSDKGLGIWILAGPLPIRVYPDSGDKKIQKEKAKSKPQAASGAGKKGGSLKEFLPMLRTAVAFLGDLCRKLRVRRLDMLLVMGGDDPCDLAVAYGRAWAAAGNILPQLEQIFVIKKRDVKVACDFTSDNTRIYLRLDLTITLFRLLHLIIKYGLRAFKEYKQMKNQRKGGAG